MSKATRKHITPGVLATALGVVAVLALMAAVAWLPGSAQAQSGPSNPFAPAPPTDVIATVDSATQVTVTWTAGSGGGAVTGYEVERKVGSGSFMGVDPAHAGTTPSYTDTNVESGMTYMYQVRANGSGAQNSRWADSNEVTVTASIPQLPMPMSVMVEANADRELTVSWDMVTGADGYMVSWSPASEDGTSSHELGSGATSYTITDLQPATAYSVQVVALGVSGESTNSDPAMASGMTNPVAYDLLLSHGPAGEVNTCAERTRPRDQCEGASEFGGGDFEEVAATLNGAPDLIDKATVRTDSRVVLHAEVKTDSPAETTTVTIRIENGSGTDGLDDNPGIMYSTSGLNAPGVRSIEDGTLDIQIRDEASRVFDVYVDCASMMADLSDLTGTLDLEVRDADQRLVAQATIMCAPPIVPPTPEERVSACYTISGMPDNGDDPATSMVEGEDIELLTTDKSVVVTVSSFEKTYKTTTVGGVTTVDDPVDCPDWPQTSVFLRLVDMPGAMPMVDDDDGFVDENGLINDHGQVVGVSSGGELMLDIMDTVAAPAESGDPDINVRRGTFMVLTPEDVEQGDRFFVELYDNLHSQRINHQNALTGMAQDYERVVYCSSPATAAGACEAPMAPPALTAPMNVMGSSTVARELTLTWDSVAGAEYFILVAVDVAAYATGTLRYETASATAGATMGTVSNLTSGTSYLGIVFSAKGTGANMELLHAVASSAVTVR